MFATYHEQLIHRVIEIARHAGWSSGEYEFEMLYGVRPASQRQIRSPGETLRLYVPFGTDWWPYAVRRVGENPRNLLLLGRSLLQRTN